MDRTPERSIYAEAQLLKVSTATAHRVSSRKPAIRMLVPTSRASSTIPRTVACPRRCDPSPKIVLAPARGRAVLCDARPARPPWFRPFDHYAEFLRIPPGRMCGRANDELDVSTMVRFGSGSEIPCAFGTSGSMSIAAFELKSQSCQLLTFPSGGVLRGYCSGLTCRLLACPIVPVTVRQKEKQ